MFRNYLKIAWRNLKKNKLHSFINIAGLAIGMAVSILILSYVWYELSFDRFHSKYDQIYKVVFTEQSERELTNNGSTGPGMATALKEDFPEIQHVIRMNGLYWDTEVSYKNKKIFPERGTILLTDNDIFKIFDIELIQGDPRTALLEPNSVVLTEEVAKEYFGDEYPIGKFLHLKRVPEGREWSMQVTGVAKGMPVNSHFSFKFLTTYWQGTTAGYRYPYLETYLTLPSGYPAENLESKFPEMVRKHFAAEIEQSKNVSYDQWLEAGNYIDVKLMPLSKLHLDNKYKIRNWSGVNIYNIGNRFQVRMYTIVAFLIILLACINFITLSTARSGSRAKEVGIRKVSGAKREQLIRQFLTESVLLSLIALVFAIIMVALLVKPINNLLRIQTFHDIRGVIFIIISLFVITLIIGVLAGSYPAFYLSAFKPVSVLKGQLLEKMKGMSVRNGLVVFQFMISIALIISSMVVYKQYLYMQNKDLGYDKENIVIIKNLYNNLFPGQDSISVANGTLRAFSLRQEILKNPNVVNASLTGVLPGTWGNWGTGQGQMRVRSEGPTPERKYHLFATNIDHSYLDVFGMELAAGRNFKKSLVIPQSLGGVIINEAAVNLLGLEEPIGKHVYRPRRIKIINNLGKEEWVVDGENQYPIIGVIKDFHTHNLYSNITPYLFRPPSKEGFAPDYLAIRFMPGNVFNNISRLEETWKNFAPDAKFEYQFFDQVFENRYNKEKKLARIFTFFCILAIFIACLGIFGLAAFTAEQRTKEIGIRKIMGASIQNIVEILSKIYLKLIFVAILFACPAGYLLMSKWLQKFPFHTNIGVIVFVSTILIILLIVLSSVSYHSIKAALTNPARTLKYE